MILVGLGIFIFLNKNQANVSKEPEGEGTNFVNQYNPFGNKPNKNNTTTPVDVSGYIPQNTTESKLRLKKISSVATAGYGLFLKERLKEVPIQEISSPDTAEQKTAEAQSPEKKNSEINKKPTPPATEFALAIRYASKVGGDIYQTFADKIEERKFGETKIPRVYDAYFGNDSTVVILRYLKTDDRTIETFLGSLPKEYLGADGSSLNEIKGSFLPENIKDISLSQDSKKVFYLFNITDDKQIGIILDLIKNKKTQVFDSPFTEWLSTWGNNKTITLNTKPASGIVGHTYKIDDTGKNLSKILTNITGLTSLISPDSKSVLYGDDSLSLYNQDINTKNSTSIGVRTLPEKCAWSKQPMLVYCAVPKNIPTGDYPDSWYQGEVSFKDQIWKIDLSNNTTTMVADPNEIVGEEIDGIKLSLDPSENFLFFINKKDNSLWELSLNQN